jgi:phosphoribosylaminoimidazole synthetase
VRSANNNYFTAGGRVLSVSAEGDTLSDALQKAYAAIGNMHFSGMHYRRDIGNVKPDHYAQAGVNIAAGARTIELMTAAVRSTYGAEVLAGIGAFGGMYHAQALQKMQDPVLVASTDGIGTKVHLAAQLKRYESLGHDIVNHSINDILVQGARPLFFLDYLAAARLVPETMAMIVTGMAEACRAANCALLGGETAEMPGVYATDMFDVAGTIIGMVERAAILPRKDLAPGDVLLGIASSGPHTNGYSLIRKVCADQKLDVVLPELGQTLGDALLAPHRSYLPLLQPLLQHAARPIKGLIHITGGGFFDNIPRVLPENIGAEVDPRAWPTPALFQWIAKHGAVPSEQMHHVFNMGIGMIIIAAPAQADLIQQLIPETIWPIGRLVAGERKVTLL